MINYPQPSLFARIAIKLLQGPIYTEDKNLWRELKTHETQLHEYFGKIGLILQLDEPDGFARLIQPNKQDGEENPLPRLMRKVTMNYETTLLAILLREMLEEFDVRSENTKLFVTQKEIKERIELFYKDQTNRSKLWKDLSRPVDYLVNMGVLKLVREDIVNRDQHLYEVRRIIKAIISNERLELIKQKMDEHVSNLI